ncbi:hypothetical protein MKA60_12000 [[Clostridium] innocuum]|nr:hypothetical protein [[Clostridium] innocuum]
MYQIILVSHNGLAKAMYETAQLMVGEHPGVLVFGLDLEDDIEHFRKMVTNAVKCSLKKGDVLILSDIQSGSPFNVTVGIMEKYNLMHFTGMNLAMVLEAICSQRTISLQKISENLEELGQHAVINVNELLSKKLQDNEEND